MDTIEKMRAGLICADCDKETAGIVHCYRQKDKKIQPKGKRFGGVGWWWVCEQCAVERGWMW